MCAYMQHKAKHVHFNDNGDWTCEECGVVWDYFPLLLVTERLGGS